MSYDSQQNVAQSDQLAASYLDTAMFCGVVFPEDFYAPFNEIHEQMFQLIDARDSRGRPAYRKICIAAPRGIGKTTITTLGICAKAILFREHFYIMYISNTATVAEEQTENLKRALLASDIVKSKENGFGGIKCQSDFMDMEEQFSKQAWVAQLPSINPSYIGTKVQPRGSGQQVRGKKFGRFRPSLFIFDDLEDPLTIDNKEIRDARWKWFMGDPMRCVGAYDEDWQMIYIDTLKHEDALITRLMEDRTWKSVKLSICDEDYNTLCPTFLSTEQVKEIVQEHRDNGTIDIFSREMMNEPISQESANFKQEHFRYYNEAEERLWEKRAVENAILIDPAKTTNLASDDSAIVGWGLDTANCKMYVRNVVSGRFHPEELYKEAIDMAVSLDASVIGLEVNSLNEFIEKPFQDYMNTRGHNFEIVKLKPRSGEGEFAGKGRGKFGRIAALAFYYRLGIILHNPNCCGKLEAQLKMFPKSKKDDVMDCASYIIQLMDMGERFFLPIHKRDGSPQVNEPEQEDVDPWGLAGDTDADWADLKKFDLPPLRRP